MNKQNIQTHRYREHTDGCQMGGGFGGQVNMDEGVKVEIGCYKIVTEI